MLVGHDDDDDDDNDDDDVGDGDDDDDDDDDDGYPAYSHQSYSHQVGICRNDKGWEYDTVKFPPYPYMMISIIMRGLGNVGRLEECHISQVPQLTWVEEPDYLRHSSDTIPRTQDTPQLPIQELPTKWQ